MAAESNEEPTDEEQCVWFELGPPIELCRKVLFTDTGEETSNIVYARVEFMPSGNIEPQSVGHSTPSEVMQVYCVTEVNGEISVLHLSRDSSSMCIYGPPANENPHPNLRG